MRQMPRVRRDSFLTSKAFFIYLFLTVPVFVNTGCSGKKTPAATTKEGLQRYLDCLAQKDIDCVYNMVPGLTRTTADETFDDIRSVRARAHGNEGLLRCFAKRAGLDQRLLDIKSGKDVLAYALRLEKRELSGIVGGMRNTVKSVHGSGHTYIGKTYAGITYRIVRTPSGRFLVTPLDKVLRRLNRSGAAAVLMLRMAKTSSDCKAK